MSVIVDTNCIGRVFDPQNKEHAPFAPLLKWIFDSGYIVTGGAKYNSEFRLVAGKLPLMLELERKGKISRQNDASVDLIAGKLKKRVPEVAFNDEHIVALVIVSRCRLVCTKDKESDPYLKRRDLYPKGLKPPRIYRTLEHKKLCCASNVIPRTP